ncbi:hypothetical protein DM01DRAFT_1308461 [Hesseltinella vesiculosa]|uniref:Zn(2)-C6 fungal-type domain-containing protein n=1 Tax=Hesseltinella vesiculosa TaxID=101127 RepID=A0A1X2GBV8_9FUNG|nr:hypothetical protein DM01DRAFT_1308461 [Hesseltinella vesiculosa]
MSNTGQLIVAKRKISCLPCRSRKVKCDGHSPCHRCIKRNDTCTYQPPGKAGRPANNAVMNRFVKLKQERKQKQPQAFYNDFIFETLSYTIHTDTKYISTNHSLTLGGFLEPFFQRMTVPIRQWAEQRIVHAIPFIPDIVMYDLYGFHAWNTMEIVNVVVSRISSLGIKHFNFYDPVAAAVFLDLAFKFLGEKIRPPLTFNPLTSLDSDTAITLIDNFFKVHPQAFLLNKTLVLQGYWLKTIDPMLLAAILGTTIYFSRMLDNKPVRLWDAIDKENRNPFLEYAHDLLHRSTTAASFSKYQASVLLGLFDSTFGLPKRGMGTMVLAAILGRSLGIAEGTFITELTSVEAELIRMAYWCTFNVTVRGCIDHGHLPDYTLEQCRLAFPPSTPEKSVSYQFELSNGYTRDPKTYTHLLESFYTLTVVSVFTVKMLRELPEIGKNVFSFGPRKGVRVAGLPRLNNLQSRFQRVLQDFGQHLSQNRAHLSRTQALTVDSVLRLYTIHTHTMRSTRPATSPASICDSMFDVFLLYEPDRVVDVEPVLPVVYAALDDLLEFAAVAVDEPYLPQGVMMSVLDTCLEALIAAPETVVQSHYFLIVDMLCNKVDYLWKDWSSIETVRHRLQAYNASKSSQLTTQPAVPLSPAFSVPILSPLPEFTAQDQLGMAAFFDPFAISWMDAESLTMPVDMHLVSHSPLASTSSYVSVEAPKEDSHYTHDEVDKTVCGVSRQPSTEPPQHPFTDAFLDPTMMDPFSLALSIEPHPTFSTL